jgi:hypothetical protein
MICFENYGTIPEPSQVLHALLPGIAESFALQVHVCERRRSQERAQRHIQARLQRANAGKHQSCA